MNCQFNTDCEGPISKNDNAYELSQEYIPQGGEFFAKISKYDDFLADIAKKPGYKAGDTLKLILPFLKAYGATEDGIIQFSSQNILLVPGADVALRFIRSIMPTFIVSTSYRPYINSLCKLIDFPVDSVYCTELAIDNYKIPKDEISYLKKLHDEIIKLPEIDLPNSARSESDLDEGTIKSIDRLDGIFWKEIVNMESGRLMESVNPIGGSEKAQAIKRSCERTGINLAGVMYAGDSITDMEAMSLVRSAGGVAVSFNGNRYAISSVDIACMSPNALILAVLAVIFKRHGANRVFDIASEWDSVKRNLENELKSDLPDFSAEGVLLHIIDRSNIDEISSQSEKFRKTVRGERIGRLG